MDKKYDFLLAKAQNFCSYQERCMQEVINKLKEWQVRPGVSEKIIRELVKENYLNEERFAKSFARGKFSVKKWGENKIAYELKKKNCTDLHIQTGLQEIGEEEYLQVLREILRKKNAGITETNSLKRQQKLANYAINKGYQPSLVWDIINKEF